MRATRVERVTQPVEAGVPFAFGDERGPLLEWQFADGTPALQARSVRHAFSRSGRFVVTGTEKGRVGSDFVAWRVELEVVPRFVTHAVPADAEALLYSPSAGEDFVAVVDFLERLVGAASAQRYLDTSVLPALAVDATAASGSLVDPAEGVGLFLLPGFEGQVALLGVVDEDKALAEIEARLNERGRVAHAEGGVVVAQLPEGDGMAAFVDRGYAYVALAPVGADPTSVVPRIRGASAAGLLGQPALSAHPVEGQLRLYVTAGESAPSESSPSTLSINALVLGVTVRGSRARFAGDVAATAALWPVASDPVALLAKGPAGPVAALAMSLPPNLLATVLAGQSDSPRRERYRQLLKNAGVDLDALLRALSGAVGALAYFDAEAFLRNLVEGTQRPDLRGAVLVDVGLTDAKAVEASLQRVMQALLPLPTNKEIVKGRTVYSTRIATQDVRAFVDERALRVAAGSSTASRPTVDLAADLSERFEGAFAKGHASLLVDLGRLRAELTEPRTIAGLDPTRVVTVQGFASAFVDQLTPIDHVLLDMVPTPTGAAVTGELVLKERER